MSVAGVGWGRGSRVFKSITVERKNIVYPNIWVCFLGRIIFKKENILESRRSRLLLGFNPPTGFLWFCSPLSLFPLPVWYLRIPLFRQQIWSELHKISSRGRTLVDLRSGLNTTANIVPTSFSALLECEWTESDWIFRLISFPLVGVLVIS